MDKATSVWKLLDALISTADRKQHRNKSLWVSVIHTKAKLSLRKGKNRGLQRMNIHYCILCLWLLLNLFGRGSSDLLAHQQAKGECPWNLTEGAGLASLRLQLQAILGMLELFGRAAASSSFAHSLYPGKLSQTKSLVAGGCLLLRELHIGRHYPVSLDAVLKKKKLRAASRAVGLNLSHAFSEMVQCETDSAHK